MCQSKLIHCFVYHRYVDDRTGLVESNSHYIVITVIPAAVSHEQAGGCGVRLRVGGLSGVRDRP